MQPSSYHPNLVGFINELFSAGSEAAAETGCRFSTDRNWPSGQTSRLGHLSSFCDGELAQEDRAFDIVEDIGHSAAFNSDRNSSMFLPPIPSNPTESGTPLI